MKLNVCVESVGVPSCGVLTDEHPAAMNGVPVFLVSGEIWEIRAGSDIILDKTPNYYTQEEMAFVRRLLVKKVNLCEIDTENRYEKHLSQAAVEAWISVCKAQYAVIDSLIGELPISAALRADAASVQARAIRLLESNRGGERSDCEQ